MNIISDSISDIKLETENDGEDENPHKYLSENIYHPRIALKNAIIDWLPDFFHEKQAFGPIVKPHPNSFTLAPILPPIIPSINTCMTLTLTTPTASSSVTNSMMVPEVNTAQLHALADICSSVTGATEIMPKPSVMNSLVSATKVVTTDVICNPILAAIISIPDKMPVSSVPIPVNVATDSMEIEKAQTEPTNDEVLDELMDCGTPKPVSDTSSLNSDVPILNDIHKDDIIEANGTLNCQVDEIKKSPMSDDVVMAETTSSHSMQIESSDDEKPTNHSITYDDILLLCDLFYLPFEHGKQGLQLLNEFQWLKINANAISGCKNGTNSDKPEAQEWTRRSEKLLKLGDAVFLLTRRIATCVNRELCYDLFTYAWEISSVVSIYIAYVKWLALGKFPVNSNSYTQGSYTWFSKGWKETFMSGDQEPWVRKKSLLMTCKLYSKTFPGFSWRAHC